MDGDGDLDVVTAESDGASRIHFNNGFDALLSRNSLPVSAEHIAVGDIDDDGDVDPVSAESGPNSIWLNDGSGVFTVAGPRLGNAVTSHIALGDLDNDGDLDIVTANWTNDANKIWINESGTFLDAGLALDAEHRSEHVALGDVDEDGDLDIHFASRGAASTIYFNDIIAGETLDQIAADINSDGGVDFRDFLVLATNFGSTDATAEEGDIDGNGSVDFLDFLALARDFGKRL